MVAVGLKLWLPFCAWSFKPHSGMLQHVLHGRDRAHSAYIFYYWGVLISLLILGVAMLEETFGKVLVPTDRPIRWLAGHTFSLYLFHFPLCWLMR